MSAAERGRATNHQAYTVVEGHAHAPVFLTCEHASQHLPAPYRWHESDMRLVGTHWAYDIGAREVTLELARVLNATAVLAEFSRLLVDPNRSHGHPDLFRGFADGEPVFLNQELSAHEQQRRVDAYHRPYHAAVDYALRASRAPLLMSIHSFTPNYEGSVRSVELGVLFDEYEEHALALGEALARDLPNVAYNEPWSGKDGLIYSAESHARKRSRVALEIEIRQDLAADPGYRRRLVPVLAAHIVRAFGALALAETSE